MKKEITNNVVSMEGKLVTPFSFSHEVFGEGFYTATLSVPRLSEQTDEIIIMISERLIDVNTDMAEVKVRIQGQFRSYNQYEGNRKRLVLSLFVREVEFLDVEQEVDGTKNEIYLNGYVCKPTIYRKTPLGREITDILLAVNRPYGKSDYVPCIAWGRNARYASALEVGTNVEIWGRIQSRNYSKKISDIEIEKRVAYEVSISKINEIPYFNKESDPVPTEKEVKQDAEGRIL